MIKCFDEKIEPEINMKTVVKWTYESWAQVTSQTVANFWKHTKLIAGEPDENLPQPNIEDDVANFHQALNINLNEKVFAKEYLNDAVETELITTNIQELVEGNHVVIDEEQSESADNDIIENKVKHDDALNAISTVIDYCDQNVSLKIDDSVKILYKLRTLIEYEHRNRDEKKFNSKLPLFV